MTRTPANWFNRVWTTVTESSAAAVAIHYAAPWNPPAASAHRGEARRSACAA
jgi:hypothetical protein